ncbi:MAG: prolyl oligopeptidase family serine peptidase [Actinomycetota bacterium]
MTERPGEWKSPLTAADISKAGVSASWPSIVGDDVWWLETRPEEKGRKVVVSKKLGDLLPEPFSANHSVHEYGGRSYLGMTNGNTHTLYFSNKSDQRIYRMEAGKTPVALTPDTGGSHKYAEMIAVGDEIWCVREVVSGHDCKRDLIALSQDGDIRTLVSGHHFYMNPRISPDGKHLIWISWEHPLMPWDGTELYLAEIENGEIKNKRVIAGNQKNPVLSPEWLENETVIYIDEASGWWNPWKVDLNGNRTQIVSEESEWGFPAWQLGYRGISVLHNGKFVGAHGAVDARKLALVDPKNGEVEDFETEFTHFSPTFASDGKRIVAFGASSTHFQTLIELDPSTLKVKEVLRPNPLPLAKGFAPSINELTVKGPNRDVKVILHRATHPDHPNPGATPLLVQVHGGPTGHSSATVDLDYLYWTTRGFTIADINYGGSTGYGSKYRHLLDGKWGIVDYEDVITSVEFLIKEGIADAKKIFISGGSAGGFTVLNALIHSDLFVAGADHYGVAELTGLATDTHDFESRYLDSMIGPYPERKDLYDERSPLTHSEKLTTPLIIFQGLDDKVVPPSQSEAFRDVCVKKGLKHKYFTFEGEGHGFVKAESRITSLEEELQFFGEAGGFKPFIH